VAALLLMAGCKAEGPVPTPAPEATQAAASKVPLPVDLVPAPPTGDVQDIVQRELTRATSEGRRLLVYVGATWCEPCQRFHQAAKEGKVDALFPGLRLLEFDLDRDRERLVKAGYTSKLIPLFALPRLDGMASGEQIEGSIKGPGAVDQIAPRLQALLDERP
jgi:thiol-disulfide isomerase/thioredoxin